MIRRLLGLGLVLVMGCSWITGGSSFDSRSFSVQTVSLFSQRIEPKNGKANWKGDWVFRRDRLKLVDNELRSVKPDLLIMQDVMERSSSPSESDRAILLAGALQSYDWESISVARWEDTDEDQSLAVAADLPLKIRHEDSTIRQKSWVIGADGYMAESVVRFEGNDIIIFNVQMPTMVGKTYLWYTFVQERILAAVRAEKACLQRVVVAGLLPANLDALRFKAFVDTLQLKDASEGFCDVASKCFTATQTNDLFGVSSSENTPFHSDKILVSKQAIVYSSGFNFSTSAPAGEYREVYGLEKLWPTQRFGWLSSIRFPRCVDSVGN